MLNLTYTVHKYSIKKDFTNSEKGRQMNITAYLPGLTALLGAIAAVFAGINGFSLVHEGEEGLLKRFGRVKRTEDKKPLVLNPGFRILIPWAYVVIKRSVRLQTLTLSQQFVTRGGLVYSITAIINFTIIDIYKALIDVTNLDEYLKNLGTMIIHEKVTAHTSGENPDLIPDLVDINSDIEADLISRQENLGIATENFKIVSFAPTVQAQQVLSISARVRTATLSLAEFFGEKEKALEHPQITAALIGVPVSTTVN